MIEIAADLAAEARGGSRSALAAIVEAIERPIYNLSLRMLANREDAEDATQEILIKIVTSLGSLRETRAAGAWAFRIACRHLVRERRTGRLETRRLTFETFAADLAAGLADPGEIDPETRLAIEEIKIGCTLAMLLCLPRQSRAAYVLGEILEMNDSESAAALEISPAAFRQRLARARSSVASFTGSYCGIVSEAAACRCARRLPAALACGRVRKGGGALHEAPSIAEVRAMVSKLEAGRAGAALMRSNPDYQPPAVAQKILSALDMAAR